MKQVLWFFLIISIFIPVYAKHSDAFLNGVFSLYDLRYSGDESDTRAKFDLLGHYLHEAGFNATTYSLILDGDFDKLDDLLPALDRDSIDAIHYDLTWSDAILNRTPEIGVASLSCGNYLHMESEYMLHWTPPVPPNTQGFFDPDILPEYDDSDNDKMNYVFQHDTGHRVYEEGVYSNERAWVCDPALLHNAGLALYCPRFRWSTGSTALSRYISNDFKFLKSADAHPENENKLYLRVALKWTEGATNVPVATIKLKVLKKTYIDHLGINPSFDTVNTGDYDVNDQDLYQKLVLIPESSSYTEELFSNDLNDAPVDEFGHRFHIFEYTVSLPPNSGSFNSIDPEIYWEGHTKLYIDYIELEDELHHQMMIDNSEFLTRLQRRLDNIDGLGFDNIAYYYTADEPYQGSFDTYKKLQTYMSERHKKIITANYEPSIDKATVKPNSLNLPSYYHPGLFLESASPERIMVDYYPLIERGDLIDWNSNNGSNGIQNKIGSLLLNPYHRISQLVHGNNDYSNTELLFVPQIYGEKNASTGSWSHIYPPRSMMKCLQMLPLCYGVDGIVSFEIASNPNTTISGLNWIAPLEYETYPSTVNGENRYNNLQVAPGSGYQMLTEANSKINIYGPIIKDLHWVDADAIMTDNAHQNVDINDMGLTSLIVCNYLQSNPPHNPDYEGYVQCGYYNDNANNPSFMLVNRRAVYRSDNLNTSVGINVDASFTNAPNQTVQFTFTTDAVAHYGGRLGLYDPYSHDLQVMNPNRVVDCTIDAGDGSLRQVVAVLQPNVTANYSEDSDVFVTGDVHIQNGAEVTIHPGRTLNILNHSRIYVQNGSTLNIAGNHFRKSKLIADLAGKIYVSQGGALVIQDTECDMSDSTFISLIGGELSINNSQFNLKCGGNWKGITSNGSHINISSSTIYKAEKAFSLNGSSFAMENTDIYIPTNGTGIEITNRHSSDEIILSGLEEYENHIQGQRETTRTTGISMKSMENPLCCAWTVFSNLTTGIEYSLSADKADSVTACSFTGCRTGIFITGTGGLAKIRQCNFTISNQGLGIDTHVYIPLVDACDFESPTSSNNTGIYLDNVQTISGQRGKENIRNCTFTALKRAIESRGSQARLEANYLNCNESGIVSHQNSLIDCSYDASNVFNNIWQNVYFYADSTYANATYCSTIEMLNGHNDFIHAGACYDFRFSTNYDYHGLDRGHIRASGNYWSLSPILGPDDNAVVYPPEHHDVIDVGNCDPAPNMLTAFATPSSRYEQALAFEDANDCTAAFLLYKQILSERLPDEKAFWDLCIPSIFKIAKQANLNLDELIAYYDLEISATSPEDSIGLIRLMKAYQANTYLAQKDYQAASDIIKERIANPISEADSLEAVMDMEIVYILRDLDESKRPLITSFSQYHYPDLQTYKVKHEENRLKLDALYDIQEETPSSIPTAVYLSRNYPNPFNPTTTIEFGVPKAAKVSIRIYNIRGQLVKELVNQKYEPGKFKVVWEGKNSFGKPVATGVYFYRLEAGGKCFTHKMLMLK